MSTHSTSPLPEGIPADSRVVLFDGVCNLCNAWSHFLIKRDGPGELHLASVQSRSGQALLARFGLSTETFDTMVFVEETRAYIKSDAFLRIVRHLSWPWPLLSLGVAIPRPVRDWLYDRLARNRYRLFGKSDSCMMPTPEIAGRFLR